MCSNSNMRISMSSDFSANGDVATSASVASLRRLTLHDRANSDTSIAHSTLQRHSCMSVSKNEYILGRGENIIVYWDIQDSVGATDWIGLFLMDETDASNFLDQKSRGLQGSKSGEVSWCIDNVEHHFTDGVTKVCFRYYHGASGELRASTPAVSVKNLGCERAAVTSRSVRQTADAGQITRVTLSEMNAKYLKKGMFFNPDPYVKMSVQPGKRANFPTLSHHGQETRTTIQPNTTSPAWTNEEFTFEALPSDVIEFEVKDKFAKSRPTISRFLGKLTVPVQRLIDRTNQGSTSFTLNLMRRNPSDNVSGLLVFSVAVERPPGSESSRSRRNLSRRVSRDNRSHPSSVTAGTSSPSSSPRRRRKHRHGEHTCPNGVVPTADNAADGEVSEIWSRVTPSSTSSRRQMLDSAELEDTRLLSHSPPNLSAVPSIECGSFIHAAHSGGDNANTAGDTATHPQADGVWNSAGQAPEVPTHPHADVVWNTEGQAPDVPNRPSVDTFQAPDMSLSGELGQGSSSAPAVENVPVSAASVSVTAAEARSPNLDTVGAFWGDSFDSIMIPESDVPPPIPPRTYKNTRAYEEIQMETSGYQAAQMETSGYQAAQMETSGYQASPVVNENDDPTQSSASNDAETVNETPGTLLSSEALLASGFPPRENQASFDSMEASH